VIQSEALGIYAIARLNAGLAVNGEAALCGPESRAIVDRLHSTPADRRAAVFAEAMAERPDGPEVIRAVAAIDPTGPAPDPGPGDWGPIGSPDPPTVAPFPLRVLPPAARDLAEHAARSIPACPPDYPAVACLAAASAVVGRSAILRVKGGYFQHAAIFTAIVGKPSAGKTPAIDAAMRPAWKIERALKVRWQVEIEAWEEKGGDDGPRGPRPVLQRILTTDATVESVSPILDDNPRGLAVAPDELTKLLLGMNQFKPRGGSDRPFYMAAWSGSPIRVDRAKNAREPLAIDHPFVAVCGGCTPDMLSVMAEERGRGDGFIDRFLFSYPDPVPKRYSEDGIPDAIADGWAELVDALWRRPMGPEDEGQGPGVVEFSAGAREAWRDWCEAHYREQEADDFPEALVGPWGKLEAYAARFCLLLHLMDLASDPTAPADALPSIPRRIVDSAAELVAYFKSHARRAHWTIAGKHRGKAGELALRIVKWLRARPDERSEFSEADIRRHKLSDDPTELAEALAELAALGWIRALPIPERPKGAKGRNPSPRYAVHPEVAGLASHSGNKCNNAASWESGRGTP
jgi:hypothetical protein